MSTTTMMSKPAKPRPDFPLTPNPNGQWSKKWKSSASSKSKPYYFGRWDDPTGAEKRYNAWLAQREQDDRVPTLEELEGDVLITKVVRVGGDTRQKKADQWPPLPADCPLSMRESGYLYYNWPGYGQQHYGHRRELEVAMEKWLADPRHAGHDPNAITVKHVVDAVLEVYKKRQTAGIRGGSDDTLYEFKRVTTAMLATLGAHTPWESLKKPDWKRLRTRLEKPLNRKYQTLGKKLMTRLLGHVKTCAKLASKEWGFASPAFGIGWDDVAEGHRPSPIRNRPGKSPIARKAYDQDECWSIIFDAPPLEQAACLLGLNGGMGAADIGVMRISDLDLETGWFNDVRSKVKKIRRFRMWPETVAAIKRVLNETPRNPLFPDYIFLGHAESNDPLLRSLTHPPRPLVRERPNGSREACVFSKFLCRHIRNCGFDDPRRFYGLRHTFEWCGDHLDERVTSDIMTHSIMADVRNGKGYYRTASHDARSRDVTDFVRNWVILKGDDDPTKFVRATDSPYEPLPDPVPLISKSR